MYKIHELITKAKEAGACSEALLAISSCTNAKELRNHPDAWSWFVWASNSRIIPAKFWDAYEAIQQPAWDAYKATEKATWDAYEAIQQPAWDAYKATEKAAWDAYEAIQQPAWDAYKAIQQPAWDAYKATEKAAKNTALDNLEAWINEQGTGPTPSSTGIPSLGRTGTD